MLRGTILALVSGICFGLSGTASKYVMDVYTVDPLWLSSARQLGACLLFLISSVLTEPRQTKELVSSPGLLGRVVILGIFGVTLSQVGYLEAIDLTNSATATVLENSSLIFLLIYTCASRRRRPYGREALAIGMAFLGIWLLATAGNPSALVVPLAGIAWGVLAGFATALISILPAQRLSRFSSFPINAFAMLAGGILLLFLERPWETMPGLDVVGWALVLFIVVVGTFGAYALYVQAAKDAGPMRAALLATIEPIVALVSSSVLLGQVFLPTDLVGFALIMATVFLTAR